MNLTYTPFLKKLTTLFYKNQTQNIDFNQVTDIFDTFYVDRYLGKSLPSILT
jgi:hypothetical protein